MTIATNTPARAPAPGDLHRWDDLQDGCLYVDITEHFVDYVMCLAGRAQWLVIVGMDSSGAGHFDAAGVSCSHAVVVAVGLETVDDFRATIAAHQARTAA